ncbi:hypothetical protein ACJIZ3_009956 [Penstemon smallii]|uniref:Apyrase 7 n=1 Tax=Penstemon smallii TaxID=265156 RepID=A0ABD3TDZ5_9LAMI
MEPKSPSKSKLQITGCNHNNRLRNFIIISLLIIFILGLVGGYLIFKEHISIPGEISTYFTVVLDCGSTGSRVNVYEWMSNNGSKVYGTLPVLLRSFPENMNKSNGCEYHCMQTEPGLHNFVNDRFKVRASIEPLIRYAEQWVPLESRGMTPIFVFATAGMRRLPVEDAEMVLGEVENVVKEHGFVYKKSWIRVLTGKEEAYYGWVALNYKMGVFDSSLGSSTLGLLDLGGSSMQVVAEVDGSMKDEHVFRSKIGPIEHDIVAYSLPAFGLNEAFERTVIMLSHSQALRESGGGKFEVRHPCLGSGLIQNYTCHGCFALDSSNSRNLRSQENGLNSLFLVGEPNWELCKVIARAAAINSSSTGWSTGAPNSNCLGFSSYGGNAKLNLTKNSHTVTRYHALSGFFAVHHALNLSQRPNLTTLWESGQKLCSRSRSHHTSIDGQHCFRVPYLTSLIENALCLGGVEIIFGPGDVSWTLGASLIEGDFSSLNAKKSQNRILTLKDHEIISSPLLTFLVLLFFLLIVYCCQIKLPMPSRKVATTRTSLPSYLCPRRQPN